MVATISASVTSTNSRVLGARVKRWSRLSARITMWCPGVWSISMPMASPVIMESAAEPGCPDSTFTSSPTFTTPASSRPFRPLTVILEVAS